MVCMLHDKNIQSNFMTTGCRQSLYYWSNFDPDLPPEMAEVQKSRWFQRKKLAIELSKSFKMKAQSFSIFREICNYFLL